MHTFWQQYLRRALRRIDWSCIIVESVMNCLQVIGRGTPLVEVRRIPEAEGAVARVVAKMESLQPGGSVKDRIAL